MPAVHAAIQHSSRVLFLTPLRCFPPSFIYRLNMNQPAHVATLIPRFPRNPANWTVGLDEPSKQAKSSSLVFVCLRSMHVNRIYACLFSTTMTEIVMNVPDQCVQKQHLHLLPGLCRSRDETSLIKNCEAGDWCITRKEISYFSGP